MNSPIRTLRSFALLAVATVVALSTALLMAPATSSAATPTDQQRQVRNNYGAIAISVDQAWGTSYDYGTRRAATSHAKQKCRASSNYPGRCVVSVWVRNGCAATAVKVNQDGFVTRYASGYARSKAVAKRRALSRLSAPKKILAWTCTTR